MPCVQLPRLLPTVGDDCCPQSPPTVATIVAYSWHRIGALVHICISRCMHVYRFLCGFRISQAKMSSSLMAEMYGLGERFYKELKQQNPEAFEKLGTSFAEHAPIPKFPDHLSKESYAQIGRWCFRDPSIWATKSFVVAKWQELQPQFRQILTKFHIFEILVAILMPVLIAMLTNFAMTDSEKFHKFVEIAKVIAQFGILVAIVELIKVVKIVEFVLWKVLGVLSKFEFASICAGFTWL